MSKRRPALIAVLVVFFAALAATACGQSEPAPAEAVPDVQQPVRQEADQQAAATVDVVATVEPSATAIEADDKNEIAASSPLPTSGLIDGQAPIVLGVGRAVGVTPDGSAVITTAAHPVGYLSCENSPAEAFWLVPLDGSPRSLLNEHEIHSGGLDSFSIRDGKAVWMQWCDGFPIGPYVATVSDSGELSDIELLELPYEPGEELGNPRWLNDGTLSLALAGQGTATMLIVDPATGATTSAGQVPAIEAFPQPASWDWEAASERWIVPLPSGASLGVPGVGNDLAVFQEPVEHPTQPVVFLSTPSETPAWFQVVAVPLGTTPLRDPIELVSGLPSATALVGSWASSNEVLLPLRDGERWLMQSLDPVDPCSADIFIRSLNGVDEPVGTDLTLGPLTGPLANGSDLMFTTGCQGGPQTLTWASLQAEGATEPELTINAIAKVPFASLEFFHSFAVNNDQLEVSYGDLRLDTVITLGRDGILQASSIGSEGYGPRLRDELCEISTLFPPNWSVTIAGGGAGGIELRHPSGASVLAVCTADDLLNQFEIDPRNNPRRNPTESVEIRAYNPDVWYSLEDSVSGTRWQLSTATDGQPGISDVLQVQVGDRWIHVIGNASGPAALDPDTAGTLRYIVNQVWVGTTGG